MFEDGQHIFWLVVVVMLVGLYIVMANENLVKKVLGLNIFQAGVFLLYIGIGKVSGGTAPILVAESAQKATSGGGSEILYSNPLPHVLILTAIVVGVATTALALAIIVRIYAAYGTLEEDEMDEQDEREDDEHIRAARASEQP